MRIAETDPGAARPAPGLAESLKAKRITRFPAGLWEDVVSEAFDGEVQFPGGALTITPTPALTVIDIDGDLPPRNLALAAVPAIAAAIRRLDLAGSIGIDFPSLPGRAERLAIDTLIDASLPQPFERTATNGFGFLQIIRRRERPSLVEQVRFDPVATDAALLLRQAERAIGHGPLQLTARPAVAEHIEAHPGWIAELGRRTGRPVAIAADAVMKGAGHAQ